MVTRNKNKKIKFRKDRVAMVVIIAVFFLIFIIRLVSGIFSKVYGVINNKPNKSGSSITTNKQTVNKVVNTEKNADEINKTNKEKEIKDKNLTKKQIQIEENKKNNSNENKNAKIEENKKSNKLNEAKTNIENKKHISNKEYFKNKVFFGDSITEAISYYEVLEEKNVLAIKGLTIIKAKSYVSKLIERKPKEVFILFGANDIEGGIGPLDFVKHYEQVIDMIKKGLPNTKVYIQSILPVEKKVSDKNPYLSKAGISAMNECLKNMANQKKVNYLDITPIVTENKKNYYEPDGIHFKYDFYIQLMNYLKLKL